MAGHPGFFVRIGRHLRGRLTSLLIYLALAGFLALWAAGLLGPYAVAAGTVLGTVAVAVSSLGSGSALDRWLIAAAGTALVALFAVMDTADQVAAAKLKAALEKDVEDFALQPEMRARFVAFLDSRLADCVSRPHPEVDHCDDLEALLAHVSGANGGIAYYKAEILRDRGKLRDSEDALYGYLEADRRLRPADPDDGLAAACTKNGSGYCRQRTAWVCHTLANDLYRSACAAEGSAARQDLFTRAAEQMRCVERELDGVEALKNGFEQHLGTRPLNSADLRAALARALKDPARPCDAAPKG